MAKHTGPMDRQRPPASGDEARVPPYNSEAEVAVLGGILLNNEALHLVQDVLTDQDFYVEAHRRIYAAITALSESSLPVDTVTLGNELTKRGDLEKIGGAMSLANLTDTVATIANVEHYARIVREKATVRRMIYAAQEVVATGFSGFADAEEFLDEAEKSIFGASQQRINSPYEHVSKLLEKTFNDLELSAGKTGEITGIPTGFTEFDKKTAGLQRSDLVIVAGRPAMGKTSLAVNMMVNAAIVTKEPVIIFSLEMSKDQLVRRMLAAEGRVDATSMKSNSLSADDWPRLIHAANVLSQTQIHLDDTAPMTPMEIRSKSRRLKAEKGLAMIVVDYLQLMRGGGKRNDNREQEISEISRSLKSLAKELNVPIVALSQLNRGVESRPDKRPMISDLRESGAIEQDADIICFVYRDEVYNPETEDLGVAEIIIGKQRSGPTGTCKVRFFNQYARFENLAADEGPPPGAMPPVSFDGAGFGSDGPGDMGDY